MSNIKTIVASALALTIAAAAVADPKDNLPGKATVKGLRGSCQYQLGDSWAAVKVNMEFRPGVVFRTGSKSEMEMSVNGLTSALRMEPDTTLAIPVMARANATRNASTETILDLRGGAVLGDVMKLSVNSRYEIKTPHGVAGFRSHADFHVIAALQSDGHYDVTFTSVAGQMLVSAQAMPGGPQIVKTLKEGRSWTPGEGDVHRASGDLLKQYQYAFTGAAPPSGPVPVLGPIVVDPFPAGAQPMVSDSAAVLGRGNSKK
jgi:hypothetical protein